jgi:ribonuclease Z
VVVRGAETGFVIEYVPVAPGPILADDVLDVVAFPVRHRGSGNFGYLFQERSRRPFLPDRAEALGVPAGPLRRDLVHGRGVTLPDGRAVLPDEVLGPAVPGTKLVVIGDVARVDDLVAVARGADALVCESTYLWADRELARGFGHLTARQAAELAQAADVGTLLLTHVSRRYNPRDLREEAGAVFPGALVVEDFDRFEVRRGEAVRVTARGGDEE